MFDFEMLKRRLLEGFVAAILGLPLSRDTERMLVTEISHGSTIPKGWILLPEPTPKKQRLCDSCGLQIIRHPCQ